MLIIFIFKALKQRLKPIKLFLNNICHMLITPNVRNPLHSIKSTEGFGTTVAVNLSCYIVIRINLPLFYKEEKELVLPQIIALTGLIKKSL